jgi:hypothetical protein
VTCAARVLHVCQRRVTRLITLHHSLTLTTQRVFQYHMSPETGKSTEQYTLGRYDAAATAAAAAESAAAAAAAVGGGSGGGAKQQQQQQSAAMQEAGRAWQQAWLQRQPGGGTVKQGGTAVKVTAPAPPPMLELLDYLPDTGVTLCGRRGARFTPRASSHITHHAARSTPLTLTLTQR